MWMAPNPALNPSLVKMLVTLVTHPDFNKFWMTKKAESHLLKVSKLSNSISRA